MGSGGPRPGRWRLGALQNSVLGSYWCDELIESKQRREQCLITALFVLIISLQLTNSPKLLNIYFIKLMKPWKLSDPSVKEDSLTQLVFIPMGSQKELSSVISYLHIFYKEQYSKVESTNSLQI